MTGKHNGVGHTAAVAELHNFHLDLETNTQITLPHLMMPIMSKIHKHLLLQKTGFSVTFFGSQVLLPLIDTQPKTFHQLPRGLCKNQIFELIVDAWRHGQLLNVCRFIASERAQFSDHSLLTADMGAPPSTWCWDALLHCFRNAQPALSHTLNCVHRAASQEGKCFGCMLERTLTKRSSGPHEAGDLDTAQLFNLVRTISSALAERLLSWDIQM